MTTIRDVAALAGVSLGTVSRVLAGSPATSAESRQRVAAAVAQLGYLPNARAGSLRRAKTDVVGILISDVRNPFFAELAHAAEQEALRRGYVVMLANADEDAAQEQLYLRTFSAQRVDGVLMAPQSKDRVHLDRLIGTGLPVVFVDRVLPGLDVPSVTSDNVGGMRSALEYLVARGHRRIGYVGGPAPVSTAIDRLDAFVHLRAELGLPDDESLVQEGDFRAESGAAAVDRMLASGSAPTAVLAADGLMALGALAALRRHGVRDKIELMSFDDLAWFEELTPPVSAIANDATAMGREGMAALLDAVEGGRPVSVTVPTRLVDRRGAGS
ncbi:LacI family DNA-binding transcriptional regulator [Pseudonocardia sp. CA-142604]|uniref:LacI family DNA-binding transcriptional regulator n=1 Tax=Pseudonocardia sp. CA-142604 TaxID=3240024 RepID=UPI003D9432BC